MIVKDGSVSCNRFYSGSGVQAISNDVSTYAPDMGDDVNYSSKYLNGKLVIPNTITVIGSFRDCEELTEIVLPNTITTISSRAFYLSASLVKINVPDTVTVIEGEAFAYTALKELYIPNSVTTIVCDAFYGIDKVYYSGTATESPWGATQVLPNPNEPTLIKP